MSADFYRRVKSISPKAYWKEIIAVVMVLLAIFFFRSERKELSEITPLILRANPLWLLIGTVVTIAYFYLQGGMYRSCFSSVGLPLRWANSVELFLKRNFIGVFLPAGNISSLAYSPLWLRKAGYNKNKVHQASGLFAFIGLLTVFIAGLPILLFALLQNNRFLNAWAAIAFLFLLLIGLFMIVRNLRLKGKLYRWLENRFPSISPTLDELFNVNVNPRQFIGAVFFSLLVELSGILHIYIAFIALHLPVSLSASASAYIIAVLMMVISPFLRGLGAVEFSMVFVFEQFGYSTIQALSVTILFRVFEFWMPLLAGLIAYAWRGRKIFLRTLPVILSLGLGIINIVSVVTPPIHQRLRLLREYIPLEAIHASNLLVLFIGLSLLVTSAFLFRGLRNAWLIALALSLASLVGHLTKALDYEEAIFAAINTAVLIVTANEYHIRSSNKWMRAGLRTALISLVSVMAFGFIGFYFIDQRHFGIDFKWDDALLHTFKSFLLVEDTDIHPLTRFGNEFIWLLRALGFITWGFLLFTFIKTTLKEHPQNISYKEKAAFLLRQFGNSATDYFKLYRDKLFFFSEIHDGFIAYRIAGGFAIVLEEPVCAEENKTDVLKEFDINCRKMGLKPAFYRVDENSIPWFNQLRKKKMMIGQEAILEVNRFSLEGKDKKSMRNGLNSLQKKGYTIKIQSAPLSIDFISQLKKVSDEWLHSFHKQELIFSQGMFDETELMQQDIIYVEDAEGNLKAFLNIIPDYAEDECTYDLIRKSHDAPAAAMDALIIKLIEYARERKKLFLNLGMVPMTGITEPENTAEQIIKLASMKIRRFQYYKGLREFKEKYATVWENKYLVYDNDFDLLQLPLALTQVMKP